MRVSVDAPDDQELDAVLKRVRRRADWILRQIDYFDQFSPLPPERRYVSGETHLYLGRQYRLKVVEGNPEQVKLKGRYFWVNTKYKNDHGQVKKLMLDWYRSHAKVILHKRLDNCYSIARRVGIPYPDIHFRRMKKRWGSCSNSGKVLLNTELAKAPVHCIDYVIMHELCHLKLPQHGPEFYKLISKLMPDWEKRKERLEMIVI
jgi:predicted metal-dependent hydrolase